MRVSGGSLTRLTLGLSCSSGPLDMSLPELPAAEHSAELQTMLLSVWDSLVTSKTRLAGTNYILFVIESSLDGTNYILFVIESSLDGTNYILFVIESRLDGTNYILFVIEFSLDGTTTYYL